jgi:hypothetical protein
MEVTSVISKGQVTVPKGLRQQLGIRQGSRNPASCKSCDSVATFDDRKFARRAKKLGLTPAVVVVS